MNNAQNKYLTKALKKKDPNNDFQGSVQCILRPESYDCQRAQHRSLELCRCMIVILRAVQGSTVHCSTVKFIAVQFSTV